MLKFLKDNKIPLFVTFAFLIVCTSLFMLDPDVYWHIKSGEWILQNGIPQKDTFSYWGGNFLAHEWLFDILLYVLFSIGGFVGMQGFFFGILGITLFLCMSMANKRDNPNFLVYFIPFMLLLRYMGLISARPHMISLLFIVIELYILHNKKYNLLWLLPIFTLFIANVHGGSVLILALILMVYLVDYIFNNLGALDKKFILKNILIAAVMVVTMIITPYGAECALYGTHLPDLVMDNVTEWLPLIQGSLDIPVLFLALVPLACMVYTRDAKLIDILMLCMGFMMCIIWCRMITIYVCICIIYGSGYIHRTFADVFNKLKLNIKPGALKINRQIFDITIFVVLAALLVFNISDISLEKSEEKASISPTIIKNYIEENNIDVTNNIMLNDYNFGGYFIFNGYKVFMDGRNDVYLDTFGSPNVLYDYFDIDNVERNIDELLDKYEVKYFAIYADSELHKYLVDNEIAKELVSDEKYVFLEKNN